MSTPLKSATKADERAAETKASIRVAVAALPASRPGFSTPVVAIPPPPPTFKDAQYREFPERDLAHQSNVTASTPSHKRKYDDFIEVDAPGAQLDVQKQKSEEALRNLLGLMTDILEEEDNLEPDTSGAMSTDTLRYLVLSGDAEQRSRAMLAPGVYGKLESSLEKVIAGGRFARLPIDQLLRLQKLCEGALSAAESTDLTIEAGWSEDDIESWLQRTAVAETGLKSARLSLKIMAGGREEKQLYSEELLQSLLEVLKHTVDTCLTPVIEARSTGASAETFRTGTSQKKVLLVLLHHTSKIMRLLAATLTKVEVAESTITTVEFLITRLIFVENAHVEKDSALGIQKFEAFRRDATDVLAIIFARYPDQRECIVGEILTSLEKLPQTRQSARQFKLIDGKNIQLVSALIMQLVQTSGAPADRHARTMRPNVIRKSSVASDADDDVSEAGDGEEAPRAQQGQFMVCASAEAAEQDPDTAVQGLSRMVMPRVEDASRNADYIIKFFVQRALTSTKTGDQPYRNLLDIFTEDLLNVLGSTDWPAAELLLRRLLVRCIGITESSSSTAPAKNMALELLGMMGSAISDVATQVRQLGKMVDHVDSDLSQSLVRLSEEYFDGNLQATGLLDWDGPYRATLQYLQARDLDDSQIRSARGYYLTQWALGVCTEFNSNIADGDTKSQLSPSDCGWLAFQLAKLLTDSRWVEADE